MHLYTMHGFIDGNAICWEYICDVQSVTIHLRSTVVPIILWSVPPAARAGEKKGGSSCLLIFRGCPFGTQDAPSRRTVGDAGGPKPKRSIEHGPGDDALTRCHDGGDRSLSCRVRFDSIPAVSFVCLAPADPDLQLTDRDQVRHDGGPAGSHACMGMGSMHACMCLSLWL